MAAPAQKVGCALSCDSFRDRRFLPAYPARSSRFVALKAASVLGDRLGVDYIISGSIQCPSLEAHQRALGRVPRLVTADASFYSAKNEAAAHDMGVARVSIPNYATKSKERKRLQKSRWFRDAQKWRTGSEGRISVVKRRHGLNRCRYKGLSGMKRWVGLGVIGDNLINIGQALAESSDT